MTLSSNAYDVNGNIVEEEENIRLPNKAVS
jgi:hypothetical protein